MRAVFATIWICWAGADVGYDALYQSWLAPAEGCTPQKLPAFLDGTFLIGAPAGIDFKGEEFQAYLDGFGKMIAIELKPAAGEVCYRSRPLESGFYNESVKEGHVAPSMLFAETAPPRPKCAGIGTGICDMMAANDNNYVNSLVLGTDPNTLAVVTDSAEMLDLDLTTLAVKGKTHEWKDTLSTKTHMAKMGSAHPLKQAGAHVGVATGMPTPMIGGKTSIVHVYAVQPNTPNQRDGLASIEVDFTPYFHSFGLTLSHAVVPMNAKFTMPSLMDRPYMKNLISQVWEGLYLVDIINGNHTVFMECPGFPDGFNHIHIANAFENSTGVSADIGASPTLAAYKFGTSLTTTVMARNKTDRDAIKSEAMMELTRFHMHTSGPKKGQCTTERLSVHKRFTEFFRIDDRRQGLAYCVYYANEWFHDDDSYGSTAVLKHNLCTGERTYWYLPNWYPSEAIFYPSGAGEDDGAVMFTALDGETEQSYMVVLDAKTMTEVARAKLPERMGFTAHAQYYPRASPTILV